MPHIVAQRASLNPVGGRDIVCVGFNDWDNDVWTNQHHLMARLAASGSRVLFIESLGLRRPQLGSGRDLRRIVRRLRRGFAPPRLSHGVHVLAPLVIPLHGNAVARRANALLLRAQVGLAARRLGIRRPVLWAYVPQAEVLLESLHPSLVVYHCVDDIAAQSRVDTASFAAAERRYAARADLVLASAPALAERMRTLSRHVLYAPNVADTGRFAAALEPGPLDAALADLPVPRLLFVGAISAIKLDFALLRGIAAARRDWSIALVGPVGLGDPNTDTSVLEAEPNIHLLGPRPHDDLVPLLRGAEVGLIPYVHSQLTASIFPMKVYEYLAAGLPVIATGLPALAETKWVTLTDGVEPTVVAIADALEQNTPERRRQRSAAAASHSWEGRLEEIAEAVRRCGT